MSSSRIELLAALALTALSLSAQPPQGDCGERETEKEYEVVPGGTFRIRHPALWTHVLTRVADDEEEFTIFRLASNQHRKDNYCEIDGFWMRETDPARVEKVADDQLKLLSRDGGQVSRLPSRDLPPGDRVINYQIKTPNGNITLLKVILIRPILYRFQFGPVRAGSIDEPIMRDAYLDVTLTPLPDPERTITLEALRKQQMHLTQEELIESFRQLQMPETPEGAPTAIPARPAFSNPGHCAAINVVGNWNAAPFVDMSVIGGIANDIASLHFQFLANGTYTYQASKGGARWVQHTGTYTIADTFGEARNQGYVCELSLKPDKSSVKITSPTMTGVLPLRTRNLPVDEPIAYRMFPIRGIITMQKTSYAPRSGLGTWNMAPGN
jgi:hypothetical protein